MEFITFLFISQKGVQLSTEENGWQILKSSRYLQKKKGLVSNSNYNKWCKHVQLDIELRDIKQE